MSLLNFLQVWNTVLLTLTADSNICFNSGSLFRFIFLFNMSRIFLFYWISHNSEWMSDIKNFILLGDVFTPLNILELYPRMQLFGTYLIILSLAFMIRFMGLEQCSVWGQLFLTVESSSFFVFYTMFHELCSLSYLVIRNKHSFSFCVGIRHCYR